MKIWKYSMVIIGICVLILSTLTVSAESITDGTGDVYYWTGTDSVWAWKQNNIRDNIDITEISSVLNGDKITITFKVAGNIQTTEKFGYYYYYNTSDTNYLVMAMGGNPIAMATKQGGGEGSYSQGNVVIDGNTISTEFDVLGDTTAQEIWGYAAEWTEVGPDATNHEWWGDWAPNTKFTDNIADDEPGDDNAGMGDTDDDDGNGENVGNNSDGGTSPPKTPGFEILVLIAGLIITFIIMKKRK